MERIRELRKARGRTQQAMADEIGIERALLVRYENGTRTPPIDNLIIIADYFSVSLDYLVGRSDDPTFIKKSGNAVEATTSESIVAAPQEPVKKLRMPKSPEELEAFITRIINKDK